MGTRPVQRRKLPIPDAHRRVPVERRQIVVQLEFLQHRLRRAKMYMTLEIVEQAVTQARWEAAILENNGNRPAKRGQLPVGPPLRTELQPR